MNIDALRELIGNLSYRPWDVIPCESSHEEGPRFTLFYENPGQVYARVASAEDIISCIRNFECPWRKVEAMVTGLNEYCQSHQPLDFMAMWVSEISVKHGDLLEPVSGTSHLDCEVKLSGAGSAVVALKNGQLLIFDPMFSRWAIAPFRWDSGRYQVRPRYMDTYREELTGKVFLVDGIILPAGSSIDERDVGREAIAIMDRYESYLAEIRFQDLVRIVPEPMFDMVVFTEYDRAEKSDHLWMLPVGLFQSHFVEINAMTGERIDAVKRAKVK